MRYPPAPIEWHPYYRDKTWLLDWLEQRGPYADLHDIRLPIVRRPALFTMSPDDEDIVAPSMAQLVMTRHRAHGPAPYVGRPFFYVWPVGVDNLGRAIAGESRMVYLDQPAGES